MTRRTCRGTNSASTWCSSAPGRFTTAEDLERHIQAGASYVILSAPTKSENVPTVVHGVNRPDGRPQIISCASCTTNCITPVIEVAHRRLGVERAVMTTIHAYTAGQQLVDGPSKNFRRGRAGAANLVPTSTGAAQATTRAVPELAGRFDGIAVRAPIPVGSIADIVFVASRPTTTEEVNEAFRQEAATARYEGILGVSEDPLVSADIVGDPRAAVVDLELTTRRGRHAGQGDGLVRQRMGLHPPDDPRGPDVLGVSDNRDASPRLAKSVLNDEYPRRLFEASLEDEIIADPTRAHRPSSTNEIRLARDGVFS